MALSTVPNFERASYKEAPFGAVLIVSICVHVFLIAGIPLIASLMWHPVKMQRPQAFQLVKMPSAAQMRKLTVDQAQKRPKAQRELKDEPTPVPSNTPSPKTVKEKAAPQKQAAKPKENTDELESLLDELPAPVQVAAVGNFKNNWYLSSVSDKVQRYWSPATEDRKHSVTVAFIIHRDGSTSNIRISQGSGNTALDNLALRAVTLASPFGRIPISFAEDKLELNLTLYPYRN